MDRKIRSYIPYILILALLVGSVFLYIRDSRTSLVKKEDKFEPAPIGEELPLDKEEEEEKDQEPETIVVHVAGAVKEPGVLRLKNGMRIIDAVEESGGEREDADLDRINLAQCLKDEEKVYIPYIGEEISDSELPEAEINDKIDINSCSKEELTSLSGIGEKTAEKILDYREKTPFKTIQDLKNVSGIGSKKFEAIEDEIRVK